MLLSPASYLSQIGESIFQVLRCAVPLLAVVLFRVCFPELPGGDPSPGGGCHPFRPNSLTTSYHHSLSTSARPAFHSLTPITAHFPYFDGNRFLRSTASHWTNFSCTSRFQGMHFSIYYTWSRWPLSSCSLVPHTFSCQVARSSHFTFPRSSCDIALGL